MRTVRGFFDRRSGKARKVQVLPNGRWRSFAEDPTAAPGGRQQLVQQLESAGITIRDDVPDEVLQALVEALGKAGALPAAAGTAPSQFSERTAGQTGAMSSQRRRELLALTQRGRAVLRKEDEKSREHRVFAEALRDELRKKGVRL